jgi:hypothetical protein
MRIYSGNGVVYKLSFARVVNCDQTLTPWSQESSLLAGRTVDAAQILTPWSQASSLLTGRFVNVLQTFTPWSQRAEIIADNYRYWLFDAGAVGPQWLTDEYGTNWQMSAITDVD